MTKEEEAIDEFCRVHGQMVEMANRSPEDQREVVLFDRWSLKDMLAHLAAWNHVDAEHTERVRDGKEFEWISDWDSFNEREVSRRQHLSWGATMDELTSSADYVVRVFRDLPLAVWDKPCGPENKSTPRGWLEAEIRHYRDTHNPEVLRKLENNTKESMAIQPIQNKEQLLAAVRYVAEQTSRLAEKVIGKVFPIKIKSLTIFAHSEPEFELLTQVQAEMGKPHGYHNGPRVELYEPITVGGNKITHLRIRKPDPERPQVGCNDFETDYDAFKREYLAKHPGHLRLMKRPEYEMIEFSDPTFDVLAYVVSH